MPFQVFLNLTICLIIKSAEQNIRGTPIPQAFFSLFAVAVFTYCRIEVTNLLQKPQVKETTVKNAECTLKPTAAVRYPAYQVIVWRELYF